VRGSLRIAAGFSVCWALGIGGAFEGLPTIPAALAGSPLPLRVRQERLLDEALRQAQTLTEDWDPGQRDCAGFVRFLYRKAHGTVPLSWRTVEGAAGQYASASDLVGWNFELLGRDLSGLTLQTGDLLAFRKERQAPGEDWHLMVVLQAPAGQHARTLLAYHNGSRGKDGAVRKLWLGSLQESSSLEWSVLPENPRFIGVFRHPSWRGEKG
jgi:uncharacterized protein YfaT (DUF1175 family)